MYKEIKTCILCSGTLTEVLDLGSQYVVDFVKEKDESLLKAPLTLMRCDKCSFIQLKHRVNPDRLYKKFWYRSGINEQMTQELLAIVKNADRTVELKDGDKVLDIGCNDGTLLGWYPKGITTFGCDPCASLVEEGLKNGKIDIGIPDYFSESAILSVGKAVGIKSIKFKIITAIACFYDVIDPIQFLKDCKAVLHDEGVLVIQMNYLVSMLNDTAFDNICHEHVGYYSVSTLKSAVEKSGLELQGIEMSPCNGGSIRAYISHKGFDKFAEKEHENKLWLYTKSTACLLEESKRGLNGMGPYLKFGVDIKEKMDSIRKYLTTVVKDGHKVYLYGASTRGTVLMQTLCDSANMPFIFEGVAERDERKYGLRMVGTWLPIVNEVDARSNCKYMLVLPWHFKESIVKREKNWIVGGGELIFPLPVPTVINAGELMTKTEALV